MLPEDYASWDREKLRVVLAHERSHIRQGDFYLQTLAGIYAALFWFSPLGWWLKSKLSDLAEAISDRAGLQEAASRSAYAQILLEFAAAPRPTLIGVAMARTGNLSRRIERLLNDSTFRQAFAGTRRRAFLAVLLVPVALFAATTLVRVEASGQSVTPPPEPAQPAAPVAGVSTPEAPADVEVAPPTGSSRTRACNCICSAGACCPSGGRFIRSAASAARHSCARGAKRNAHRNTCCSCDGAGFAYHAARNSRTDGLECGYGCRTEHDDR